MANYARLLTLVATILVLDALTAKTAVADLTWLSDQDIEVFRAVHPEAAELVEINHQGIAYTLGDRSVKITLISDRDLRPMFNILVKPLGGDSSDPADFLVSPAYNREKLRGLSEYSARGDNSTALCAHRGYEEGTSPRDIFLVRHATLNSVALEYKITDGNAVGDRRVDIISPTKIATIHAIHLPGMSIEFLQEEPIDWPLGRNQRVRIAYDENIDPEAIFQLLKMGSEELWLSLNHKQALADHIVASPNLPTFFPYRGVQAYIEALEDYGNKLLEHFGLEETTFDFSAFGRYNTYINSLEEFSSLLDIIRAIVFSLAGENGKITLETSVTTIHLQPKPYVEGGDDDAFEKSETHLTIDAVWLESRDDDRTPYFLDAEKMPRDTLEESIRHLMTNS